jgi:hypothetical protein
MGVASMHSHVLLNIGLATTIVGLVGCRSVSYDPQQRMFLDHPGIDFFNPRGDEPLTFDFRQPTNLTDENGVPLMAEPLHLLVVAPSGDTRFLSRHDGGIVDGQITIQKPDVGRYRVYHSRLEALTVTPNEVREGEPVRFRARVVAIPNQTQVGFYVVDEHGAPEGIGLRASGTTNVLDGWVAFEWRYEQRLKEAPRGAFQGCITLGTSKACSALVRAVGEPLSELKGVQQRLTTLGYLDAPHSGVLDAATRRALSLFQQENPPCTVGITSDGTSMGCGIIACEVGGMQHFPPAEDGIGGPVTRAVMACGLF